MLPVEPSYDTTLADPAYSLAVRWDTSRYISDITKLDFAASDVGTFNSNQKSEQSAVAFLRFLLYYSRFPRTPCGIRTVTLGPHKPPWQSIRSCYLYECRDAPAFLPHRTQRSHLVGSGRLCWPGTQMGDWARRDRRYQGSHEILPPYVPGSE